MGLQFHIRYRRISVTLASAITRFNFDLGMRFLVINKMAYVSFLASSSHSFPFRSFNYPHHIHSHTLQCPTCDTQIHQSYPLNYIAHDRTMQDIVYKLVPHLLEDETERERLFYEERGLPNPKDEKAEDEDDDDDDENDDDEDDDDDDDEASAGKKGRMKGEAEKEKTKGEDEEKTKTYRYHREDEQVNICLEPDADSNLKDLKKQYIRCSSQATINQVKKYVALKLWSDVTRFKELDILCNDNCCGKDHTLKFVVISNWKCQQYPMQLKYRPKCEFF